MSKFSGNKRLRLALMIWPVLENILSEGTDVAGTVAYFNAISHIGPSRAFCLFQNSTTLLSNFWYGIPMYCRANEIALLEFFASDCTELTRSLKKLQISRVGSV